MRGRAGYVVGIVLARRPVGEPHKHSVAELFKDRGRKPAKQQKPYAGDRDGVINWMRIASWTSGLLAPGLRSYGRFRRSESVLDHDFALAQRSRFRPRLRAGEAGGRVRSPMR